MAKLRLFSGKTIDVIKVNNKRFPKCVCLADSLEQAHLHTVKWNFGMPKFKVMMPDK